MHCRERKQVHSHMEAAALRHIPTANSISVSCKYEKCLQHETCEVIERATPACNTHASKYVNANIKICMLQEYIFRLPPL